MGPPLAIGSSRASLPDRRTAGRAATQNLRGGAGSPQALRFAHTMARIAEPAVHGMPRASQPRSPDVLSTLES
jgi:hypothetical protein